MHSACAAAALLASHSCRSSMGERASGPLPLASLTDLAPLTEPMPLRPAPRSCPHPHPLSPRRRRRRHVFCRQRQDERLRRGCEQRSVVLLSALPLGCLLEPLARLAGPLVLSYGHNALREVGRWTAVQAGCAAL